MNIAIAKKFAVYVDLTCEDQPRVFYVGKGNQVRVNSTIRNAYHRNIVKKHGFVRIVVFESDDEQEALDTEIACIREFRTYVCENSTGANMTLGGEGRSGSKPSQATRQLMSESQKRVWSSNERRRIASESQAIRWSDPVVRANASEKYAEAWKDQTLRKKMSDIIKEASMTDEYKRNRSLGQQKRWQVMSDEAYAARCKIASEAAKKREATKREKRA